MPERQHHAKITSEMADRLQRSADVPRWNKSERQTIEEWAEELFEKAPLPRRLGSRNLRCPLRFDADRASVCKTKMSVANVEAIR